MRMLTTWTPTSNSHIMIWFTCQLFLLFCYEIRLLKLRKHSIFNYLRRFIITYVICNSASVSVEIFRLFCNYDSEINLKTCDMGIVIKLSAIWFLIFAYFQKLKINGRKFLTFPHFSCRTHWFSNIKLTQISTFSESQCLQGVRRARWWSPW